MPFPSTGCITCRQRRIKASHSPPTTSGPTSLTHHCSATRGRPVCQRCMKSHQICSPIGAGPIVHTETPYPNGQLRRPQGPRSVPTTTCSSAAILQRPSADMKTSAMLYYLHNHLRTPKDTPNVMKGVTDDFLPMWMSVPNCPTILELAISSIALAVFQRTQNYPAAAIEASTVYHQLLRIVQVIVSSLDQGNIDAGLLTIFFMSRYENVVHRPIRHLQSTLPFATSL